MEQSIKYLTTDWDAKLRQRFPNGVTPVETPFLRRMMNACPDFVALQQQQIREDGERRIDLAVKGVVYKS